MVVIISIIDGWKEKEKRHRRDRQGKPMKNIGRETEENRQKKTKEKDQRQKGTYSKEGKVEGGNYRGEREARDRERVAGRDRGGETHK